MSRKLIEQYRRRADFCPDNCTMVRLADGQEWAFPRPWLAITPVILNGEAISHTRHVTFGDELDVLLEAIAGEEDPIRQILCVLTLAVFLLKKNYDLEDGEFQRLLIYRAGDPDSEEMIRGIVDVALGTLFGPFGARAVEHPKASAVGSE